MIKLTDFRFNTLLLLGLIFSLGKSFGLNEIPPVNESLNLLQTPKIAQWNNQTKLQAPVYNGALVQGVHISYSNGGEGNVWNPITINPLPEPPTTNPANVGWWIDGSNLSLFPGVSNRMAVTFDLSSKYLSNVNDLELVLDANRLDSANMDIDFDLKIEVFDLTGAPVSYGSIYQGGTEQFGTVQSIYNTAQGSKLLKFFQPATDLGEDNPFIKGSLDNKLIRLTLVSHLPVGEPGAHFPASLVIRSITMSSDVPVLTLQASAPGLFEAGMNYKTPFVPDHALTLGYSGLTIPTVGPLTNTEVEIESPAGFKVDDGTGQAVVSRTEVLGTGNQDIPYTFNPSVINTFNGPFKAKAKFINTNDLCSPIQTLEAVSGNVTGSSIPELHLSEDKMAFDDTWTSQKTQIWGKNLPFDDKDDLKYEGIVSSDDQDASAWSFAKVNNHFVVSDLGVIEHTAENYLEVTFAYIINNIEQNTAKFLKVSSNYSVPFAIKGTDTFNGGQISSFLNPSAELKPFPQVLVTGDVAVVWFEYEGTESAPGKIVGDISTAFYAPFNPAKADRVYSREKVFYLKGAKIKPNLNDEAQFEISLQKYGTHELEGHTAFEYSTDEGITWNTPYTKDTVTVKLLTAQDALDFQKTGIKIRVRFHPDCDGFECALPSETTSVTDVYKWEPHHNLLQAQQIGKEGKVLAEALIYGDTRAVLKNTMNSWHFVDVMNNSYRDLWKTSLSVSDFRKDYGNTYLNKCGEQTNPLNKSEFYITGYNLTGNVSVLDRKDLYNPDAFVITVETAEGFGTASGLTIMPNQYGEVAAKVTVLFAPIAKFEDRRDVTDSLTVGYGGRTIVCSNDMMLDPEFNYYNYFKGYDSDDYFLYSAYEYPSVKVNGKVYDPTFHQISVPDMRTAINSSVSQKATFIATDLDKSKKKISISLADSKDTPFTIAPTEFPIDENGNVFGEVTFTFAPTSMNKCNNQVGAMRFSYGDCKNQELAFSGVKGTTLVGQPSFADFQPGDIQGDRADLRVTPALGGENYKVGIGLLKYSKKTPSIFMSEVYAKKNIIYVELFNGTAEKLNSDILSENSPNYYIEVYKEGAGSPVQTAILDSTDAVLWNPYGIIVKPINVDLQTYNNYKIVLKQGQIILDVYEFTGETSHKSRVDNLPPDSYKTAVYKETDWTTVGGWRTSLNTTSQIPLYASMFHAEYADAAFVQYFENVTVERSQYGFETGLSVSNLKKGETYTAYAYSVPTCEGVETEGHPSTKYVPCSDSFRLEGDPMEGVTFGYLTGIDKADPSQKQNIYSANGKIYVTGANERAIIYNVLGKQVQNASKEDEQAGISLPDGIYLVKCGHSTSKVIVRK